MIKRKTLPVYLLAAWCLFPVVLLFILSLSINWVYPDVLPLKFTFAHWKVFLLDSRILQRSFLNSLVIAFFVALVSTSLGFISSKYIAYHKRRNLLLTITYFPFVLSPVIFAICLKYYFLKSGLAGNLTGVIIAQLIVTYPYSTIFFISFWNNNIKYFNNLAYTLGSSTVYNYQKIILPLAKSFLLTCFFQCFIISWFEYGLTNVIGYGKVQTLTIKVFQYIGEANIFYAALSSCLLIIPPIFLLWINKRFVLYQTR